MFEPCDEMLPGKMVKWAKSISSRCKHLKDFTEGNVELHNES